MSSLRRVMSSSFSGRTQDKPGVTLMVTSLLVAGTSLVSGLFGLVRVDASRGIVFPGGIRVRDGTSQGGYSKVFIHIWNQL